MRWLVLGIGSVTMFQLGSCTPINPLVTLAEVVGLQFLLPNLFGTP